MHVDRKTLQNNELNKNVSIRFVKSFQYIFQNFVYFSILKMFLADMQISGYVLSLGQVTEANKRNDQKITTNYFGFYSHTKDNARRRYALDPRKCNFFPKLQLQVKNKQEMT